MSEIVSTSEPATATETVTVADNSMVRLVSNDGEAFELLASVAKLSKMVATGIEGKFCLEYHFILYLRVEFM